MLKREYHFYVYILASRSRTLYIGMTNNLGARLLEHQSRIAGTFTARYNITRLVRVEHFLYVNKPFDARKN